ncbi:MAG: GNAT family N-acetyltransferase [Pseudomonadota bacterium]
MTAPIDIPTLETERLILRGFKEADIAAYADFFASETSFFVGGPVEAWEAWRKFAVYPGHWALLGYGPFALEEKMTSAFVGVVGPWFPGGWPNREIMWAIMLGQDGKGYATEAARATISFAVITLGWTRIVSHIDANNHASIAVAQKLGATYEGDAEFPFGTLGVYVHDLSRFSGTAA